MTASLSSAGGVAVGSGIAATPGDADILAAATATGTGSVYAPRLLVTAAMPAASGGGAANSAVVTAVETEVTIGVGPRVPLPETPASNVNVQLVTVETALT